MKYYLIIGILLFIVFCSLAIHIFFDFTNHNTYDLDEGFQGFSASQVADMNQCTSAQISTDPSCVFLKYYNQNQQLMSGYFKKIPFNFYIDSSNILQPVPYGNIATSDKRGYVVYDSTVQYSELQKIQGDLAENAIKTADICNTGDSDYMDPVKCIDTQYVIMNNNLPSLMYDRIRIPNGYYADYTRDRKGILKKVPYGYTVNEDKKGITMTDQYQAQVSRTTYNTNNYDVTYHSDPTEETNMEDENSAGIGKMWILNASGQLVSIPYRDNTHTTLYYEPGSFRFGSSNYVPNYEETVYLSKLTNHSTASPYIDATSIGGGFCEYYKNNPDELEKRCNDVSGNMCASTSCCVLLGGQKCVYGDSQGPHYKTNYSNFLITNPEFYYYQGKCYGKCMDSST